MNAMKNGSKTPVLDALEKVTAMVRTRTTVIHDDVGRRVKVALCSRAGSTIHPVSPWFDNEDELEAWARKMAIEVGGACAKMAA